jgi:hypothetical protein
MNKILVVGMIGVIVAFALIMIFGVHYTHASSLVTQLSNDTYQVPDNWNGCFVNPDDLNDTSFGCPGETGANPTTNLTDPAIIELMLSNGSAVSLEVFANGTVGEISH